MTLASSRHTRARFLLPLLAALGAPSARAAVWHVLPDGSGDFPTIQAAVDAAADGDEIFLGDGTFLGDGNHEITYGGKDLTVRSASGQAANCVLDLGSDWHRAFVFSGVDGPLAVVRDLTIRGGTSSGIRIDGSPTIENVTFTDYSDEAIYSNGGSPELRSLTFRDGNAPAIRSYYGSPTLSDCLFESNTLTSSGSVISIYQPTDGTMERCVVRDNIAGDGSQTNVVLVRGGALTMTDCEIRDNPVPALFAIGISGLTLVLDGCTLEGNDTGIDVYNGVHSLPTSLHVRNSTIRSHLGKNGWNVGHALRVSGNVDLTVEDTTIEGNRRGVLGSSRSSSGPTFLSMSNCRILDNQQDGMYASFPDMTIVDCEVRGNGGRGVSLYDYPTADPVMLSMTGCLVAGNGGRGMELDRLTGSVIETTTIASNGGADTGGGVRFRDGANLTMRNCIVWGNCSPDDSDALIDAGCAIQFECSVVDPARVFSSGSVAFTGAIVGDPLFCLPDACGALPALYGNYELDPASPALHTACGPVGATGEGCSAISVAPSTWAGIKVRYR